MNRPIQVHVKHVQAFYFCSVFFVKQGIQQEAMTERCTKLSVGVIIKGSHGRQKPGNIRES